MWRVSVNSSCIGSGVCVGVAPQYFALGEDDRSHPVRNEIAPSELILDAAASCPMEAIRIHDPDTGVVVEP
jgi:ferredoxin